MKLTKGKISKLYNKKRQTLKKPKKYKASYKRRTFRKRKVNLARKTLKRFNYKKYKGGFNDAKEENNKTPSSTEAQKFSNNEINVPTNISTENIIQQPAEDIIIENPDKDITEEPNQDITELQNEDITEEPNQDITELQNEDITEVPNEDITELQNEDITEVPNEDITELQNEDITELPNEDITELPNQDITELPNQDITELPNQDITELKNEDITELPNQDITELPDEKNIQPTQDIREQLVDNNIIKEEKSTSLQIEPLFQSQSQSNKAQLIESLTKVVDYITDNVAEKVSQNVKSSQYDEEQQDEFNSLNKVAETMATSGGSKFKKTRRFKLIKNKNKTRHYI
jgi:hypothetical protein